MRTQIILGAAFSLLVGTAWAQYDTRPHLVVAAGSSLKVFTSVSINPDCSSLGPTQINLLQAPQGGQVTVGQRQDYQAFPPNNPRSACNHRRLAATELFYHASHGFSGYDHFSAEVIGPEGVARTRSFTIEVR